MTHINDRVSLISPWTKRDLIPQSGSAESCHGVRDGVRARVHPIAPDTSAFLDLIDSGEQIKWVVTTDGELLVAPKFVDGVEISHTVLSGGDPVLAAGEAEVARSGSQLFGLFINNHSGHYQPSGESVSVGRTAFSTIGLQFP